MRERVGKTGERGAFLGCRVGLLGATGSIGEPLGKALEAAGAELVRYSRGGQGREGNWRSSEGELDLSGLDVLINLAGEPVGQRWTRSVRERIEASRIGLSRRIVEGLAALAEEERPGCFLSGSAVGYYGFRGEDELLEGEGVGTDYLAEVCRNWEEEAGKATALGLRVIFLRTGIVLGRGGEAWTRLSRVFRWGLGGVLGSGRQWMPWIHLHDEVAAILFLMGEESISGPVNLVAPQPLRNRDFTRCLARAFHRPAFFWVPGWVLKLAFGGFAASLLGSQRARPGVLEQAGFQFEHETLESAVRELRRGQES